MSCNRKKTQTFIINEKVMNAVSSMFAIQQFLPHSDVSLFHYPQYLAISISIRMVCLWFGLRILVPLCHKNKEETFTLFSSPALSIRFSP